MLWETFGREGMILLRGRDLVCFVVIWDSVAQFNYDSEYLLKRWKILKSGKEKALQSNVQGEMRTSHLQKEKPF